LAKSSILLVQLEGFRKGQKSNQIVAAKNMCTLKRTTKA